MSWGQSAFQYLPKVISTPEIKRDHEDTPNYRMQYGSTKDSHDIHQRLNSKHKRKEFHSSSILRALTEDSFDKNDWKSILSNKNGILPTFGDSTYGKSKCDGPGMKSSAHNDLDLQVPMQTEYIESIKTSFFQLGITTGASIQLFIVSFLLMFASASTNAGPIRELSREYYPVFRCILLICFFFSLYGANIFIWRRSKVDYASVLGVPYAHTYQYVLRGSTSMAYITFTMFMLYFLSLFSTNTSVHNNEQNYVRHLWPALTVLLPTLIFICPFDFLTILCFGVKKNGFKQRWGLIKETACVLVSPFSEVTFLRSFIADIFCSMPRIFTDLQYTICIYATGTFLTEEFNETGSNYHTCGAGSPSFYLLTICLGFLPYFIRLCQSFRAYNDTKNTKNLWNALKYTLSLMVTGLAALRTASFSGGYLEEMSFSRYTLEISWVVFGITATVYSFYWDVVLDWGLGSLTSKHFLLRDELTYLPNKYYMSIALDFVMRLGWIFVISPEQQYIQENVMLLLSAVELIRRFLWSIYRVEWEHIQITKRNALKAAKKKYERFKNSKETINELPESNDAVYDGDTKKNLIPQNQGEDGVITSEVIIIDRKKTEDYSVTDKENTLECMNNELLVDTIINENFDEFIDV
mmetsp:Transcript_9411/g.9214  ORF Transcript_9411/g.9214 Transcript_9411/m.9214 type:complete len:637 (+) Transcript_9411:167-2077(+)